MTSLRSLQRFRRSHGAELVILLLAVIVLAVGACAQQATVWVEVEPSQAYIFLDGQAIRDGSQYLTMTPGKHLISAHNYGYLPQSREIVAEAGTNDPLSFTLTASGAPVAGPMGAIQIEGPSRAAVLLNGKTPDYCVGHVDEFNNHIGWMQQLVVPAGTHEVTVTHKGTEIWSGPVEVPANKRVILYLDSGERKVQDWNWVNRPTTDTLPRFEAGAASTTVAISPVNGEFMATPGQINCGDKAKLAYSSQETVESTITDASGSIKLPAANGEQIVEPKQTTTYAFRASGPGGVVNKEATVEMYPVQASLAASPSTVNYLQVGKTVLAQQSTDLKWSASNADSVEIEPVGTVGVSGSQSITPAIKQTEAGPVDETQVYTLTARNPCGGSATQSATVQIKGAVEPAFQSVFFPTAYPTRRRPELGLVKSQREQLARIAATFKTYAELNPDAKLLLMGNADIRDTAKYNLVLSERRVAKVKAFLIAQGVPEDRIQTEAFGEGKQLSLATVKQLEDENPYTAAGKPMDKQSTWLAYNRRVDVSVLPVQLESQQFFPHGTADAAVMAERNLQSEDIVIQAEGLASEEVEVREAPGGQARAGK